MKRLFSNLKWIFTHSKSVIPLIFIITTISSCVAAISVYQALVSKNLIDFALAGNLNMTKRYVALFIIISLIYLCTSPLTTYLNVYCSNKLTNKLQKELFHKILFSKFKEQTKYHSMDIVSRLNEDMGIITNFMVSTLPEIITLISTLVASFFVLFSISHKFAIISLIFLPVFLILSKFFSKRQKKIYKEYQEAGVKCNSFIQESVLNSIILKTFSKENIATEKLNNLQQERTKVAIKKVKISSLMNTIIMLGMNIGYLSVYALGAISIGTDLMTVGSFTALIQLFQRVQGPMYALSSKITVVISAIGATERVKELYLLEGENIREDLDFNNNFKKISFEDVCFSYHPNKIILNHINFSLASSDTLGIIGKSGGGKTTILKLILSLVEPSKGKILIDGLPINPIHRKLISYVPQGNILFSGSIEENLKYGNNTISDKELDEALKLSCSSEFIKKLPNGISTIIGEKGLGLSEGQAQRLTIARALLMKRPILILDESTSALDSNTEVILLKNLKNLNYIKSTIIVTHRSSTLKNCNKIINVSNQELSLYLSKNFS